MRRWLRGVCPNSAVVTPGGATMSNEVTAAGGAGKGWGIRRNQVGAGEQREGKFDTNSSVLPCKSPQSSVDKMLLWPGFLESCAIPPQHPDRPTLGAWLLVTPGDAGVPPAIGSLESFGVRLTHPHAPISGEGWVGVGGSLPCSSTSPKLWRARISAGLD